MTSKEEIRYEMERALLEWGVDPPRGKNHLEFYQKTIDQALRQYSIEDAGELSTLLPDRGIHSNSRSVDPGTKPDVESFVRHLIISKVTRQDRNYDEHEAQNILDSLSASNSTSIQVDEKSIRFVAPYEVKYDRHWKTATKSSKHYKIQHDLKEDFGEFLRNDLDPFKRFAEKEPLAPEEHMFRRLLDKSYLHDVSFVAIVHRTMMENEMACRSCNEIGSIVWRPDGFIMCPWRHFVCNKCHSTYTVQLRGFKEKGVAQNKRVEGGHFGLFHQMRLSEMITDNESEDSDLDQKKHYVILSPIESIFEFNEESTQQARVPIYVAEINTVIPRLIPESFHPVQQENDDIPLLSWIRIIPKSRKLWIKTHHTAVNAERIAKSIFDEYFPGEWDRLMNKFKFGVEEHSHDESNVDDDADQGDITTREKVTVEELKSELQKLKDDEDSDAEWDECYSD